MEVMGLMLGEFVDEYTVQIKDVFAMPQSGTVGPLAIVFTSSMNDLAHTRMPYTCIFAQVYLGHFVYDVRGVGPRSGCKSRPRISLAFRAPSSSFQNQGQRLRAKTFTRHSPIRSVPVLSLTSCGFGGPLLSNCRG
jgi:hypothetical protein